LLYAANCLEATSDVLKSYIREPLGKTDARAWHMLLDLYQLTRNAREFNALSMVYAARFERSPPAWDESRCGVELRRKSARLVRDLFRVKPAADGALLDEITRFDNFAREIRSSRIDLGDVYNMTPAEAELLSTVLARLRRDGIALWINHPQNFVPLLKKLMGEMDITKTKGYWSLLLEIFIIDRRLAEYEEAGLEFAMAFDETPPPWTDMPVPASGMPAPAGSSPGVSGRGTAIPSTFKLAGVISLEEKSALAELSQFALLLEEVTVDMGDVMRIDFNAGGFFFDSIRQLHLAGKKIILANLNELVTGFLEVFDVQHHAVLVTRTPH